MELSKIAFETSVSMHHAVITSNFTFIMKTISHFSIFFENLVWFHPSMGCKTGLLVIAQTYFISSNPLQAENFLKGHIPLQALVNKSL